jgi:transcriptional regulator with XRE-family HTH domain
VSGARGYLSPDETYDWFRRRMSESGHATLDELAEEVGINKGNLSRYFRQETRPAVTVVGPLAAALQLAPETVLIGLGVLPRPRGWKK